MKATFLILFGIIKEFGLIKFITDDEKDPIIERLFDVVSKNLRHKHYQRTVDKATLYGKLITGEGMDSLLKRFAKRETEKLFEQRKEITQHIIQSVCKNLMDVSYRLPRSTSKVRIVSYDTEAKDPENKTKDFEDILKKFWGDQTLDDWFATRFIELNYMDPNTFIVTEFKQFDENKEKAQPYPFEVSSSNAIDFQYENNVLQYLIVKTSVAIKIEATDITEEEIQGKPKNDSGKKVEYGDKYLLYRKDDSLVLTEVNAKDVQISESEERTIVKQGDKEYVLLNKKIFEVEKPTPYNIGEVPAFRVGYNRDLHTKGQTYLNPFDAAIPHLKKSIKINSEMDLTTALIAFPQMIRYADSCTNKDCLDGKLRDTGKECPVCGGSGAHIPTSVQDAITIKIPNDKDKMIDLSKLVHYSHPPIDMVKWQDEYIEKLTQRCYKTIYGSEAILKSNVTITATEKNLDVEKTYDALYPLSIKFAKDWIKAVKLTAKITDSEEGLVVSYTFGKDFKLKSKSDYLEERKIAKDAGASSDILKQIDKEIMRLSFVDNPEEYKRFQIRESFNPFSGKSDEEKLVMLSSNLTTQHNKVLYLHLNDIFNKLEMEKPDFYRLTKKVQIDLIKGKVEDIIKGLEQSLTPQIPTES